MEKCGETKPASVTVTEIVSSEQSFQRVQSTIAGPVAVSLQSSRRKYVVTQSMVTGPVVASLQSSQRKHGAQEAVDAETQKGRSHGVRIPLLLRTCLSAPTPLLGPPHERSTSER